MVQVPSPLANAAGAVAQPCPPTRAMSVRPLPLKPPVTTLAPGCLAQPANPGAGELWMVQVPSPLANATGTVAQPCPPTRAMSVRPLPLNTPVTTCAPGCVAQPANPPRRTVVGRRSHASCVMAIMEGTSMIPMEFHVNIA